LSVLTGRQVKTWFIRKKKPVLTQVGKTSEKDIRNQFKQRREKGVGLHQIISGKGGDWNDASQKNAKAENRCAGHP